MGPPTLRYQGNVDGPFRPFRPNPAKPDTCLWTWPAKGVRSTAKESPTAIGDDGMSRCPHCSQAIDPPPKRSRNCPHCRKPIVVRRGRMLTPESAAEFDSQLEESREKRRSKVRQEKFREGRKNAIREIREAKKSGVVSGFKPLVTENDCDICQKVRDRVFPIDSCTPEMLPPYEDCELEDGCRATFNCVLSSEYETLRSSQKRPSKKGCLGSILLLSFVALLCWVFLVSR